MQCWIAHHNLDLSDMQSNYHSPATSCGVIASGCPPAWILLATSKKQRDNDTVLSRAANEFSGVDHMLLSCPYGHLEEADECEYHRSGRANKSYCSMLCAGEFEKSWQWAEHNVNSKSILTVHGCIILKYKF